MRKLYEEMEQQIRAEKERILAEVDAFFVFKLWHFWMLDSRADCWSNSGKNAMVSSNNLIGYCSTSCIIYQIYKKLTIV